MPTPLVNSFSSYDFSEEELKLARQYHDLQLMYLISERASVAINKINAKIINGDVEGYKNNIIFLDGQLAAFDWILAMATKPPEAPTDLE